MILTAKKWLADLDNLQKQVAEAKQKLPDLELKVEITEKAFEQSETALKTAKTEKENSDKILVKVRELDTKIAEKDKMLKPVLQAIGEWEKVKSNLKQTVENQSENLKETQVFLQQKQAWATTNATYESLVEQFAAIENQHLQATNLLNDFNSQKMACRFG